MGEQGADFTEECHSHGGGNCEVGHPTTRGLINLGASAPAEEDLAAACQVWFGASLRSQMGSQTMRGNDCRQLSLISPGGILPPCTQYFHMKPLAT